MPRVLMVQGGWPGHEPQETSLFVAGLLQADGCEVEVSESLACYADEAFMADVDLIVQCWTMGEISPDELQGLLRAVRRGTGISGWHGGLGDAFRNEPDFQFMVGGQWVAHPDDRVEFKVDLVPERADDPIIAGLAPFSLFSERYYCHVDPSNEVLATISFLSSQEAPWVKGTVMPVVWKRRYGHGRVFYSGLGHDRADFDVPEVGELIRRGSLWAARGEHEDGRRL